MSIHQPSFWPWAGLLDRIMRSDVHFFLDCVQFEKGGYVNRNQFQDGQREPFWLTVPIAKNDRKKHIGEIALTTGEWSNTHVKSIEQIYDCGSRIEDIKRVYTYAYNLAIMNAQMTRLLMKWAKIKTPCLKASLLEPVGTKSALILDICKKAKATKYLSGMMGKDYLDIPSFEEAGIAVEFQKYVPKTADHKLSGLHLLLTRGEL